MIFTSLMCYKYLLNPNLEINSFKFCIKITNQSMDILFSHCIKFKDFFFQSEAKSWINNGYRNLENKTKCLSQKIIVSNQKNANKL